MPSHQAVDPPSAPPLNQHRRNRTGRHHVEEYRHVGVELLLVSGVLAAAPKTWTITQVLNEGSLIAINNSGRMIGELRVEGTYEVRPFVWHQGNLVYLPFTPVDINEPGQVVGCHGPRVLTVR